VLLRTTKAVARMAAAGFTLGNCLKTLNTLPRDFIQTQLCETAPPQLHGPVEGRAAR
jgi:hypothetical protein